MKIHLTDLHHGIIWWSALDYKQRRVHKVAYGLQVTEFKSQKEAEEEVRECIKHSEGCLTSE